MTMEAMCDVLAVLKLFFLRANSGSCDAGHVVYGRLELPWIGSTGLVRRQQTAARASRL